MTAPAFLGRYHACFETTWPDDAPIDRVRFVVLDSETTGLNPATDRIITIGAVAVLDGEICLDDAFAALIKIAKNTSAVTVQPTDGSERTLRYEDIERARTTFEWGGAPKKNQERTKS